VAQEKILIVEDDGILAAHLDDTLARLGYTVLQPAASGEDAIDRARLHHPDLIVMDIELAGTMNGIAAATHIQAFLDVPVVYLTAYSQDSLLAQAKITSTYGYLVKPVSERELAATVTMALHRHVLATKLKESDDRLKLALAASRMGVWEWDAITNVVFCSPECNEMVGLKDFTLTTQSCMNLLHPDDTPRILKAIRRVRPNNPAFRDEYRIVCPDSQVRWISGLGQGYFDDSGALVRAIGTVQDITERKRAEAVLAAEMHFSNFTVESLPGVFYLFDRQGKLLRWNRNLEKVSGYSAKQIADMHFTDFFAGEEKQAVETAVQKVFGEGEGIVEGGLMPREGIKIPYFFSGTKVFLDSVECLVGLGMDISVLKKLEQELREHRDELEHKVAERTRELWKSKQELEAKARTLEEVNIALKVLIGQVGEDKKEIEARLVSNVRRLVLPYVEKVKKGRLDPRQQAFLAIIEANLAEIVSPFIESVQQFGLSPRETQVVALIKDGKSTKEIAEIVGVAPSAVDTYRNKIRRKLNLSNKKINLQSYLQSLK
jgi:PAS domain S-box-containing protein